MNMLIKKGEENYNILLKDPEMDLNKKRSKDDTVSEICYFALSQYNLMLSQ